MSFTWLLSVYIPRLDHQNELQPGLFDQIRLYGRTVNPFELACPDGIGFYNRSLRIHLQRRQCEMVMAPSKIFSRSQVPHIRLAIKIFAQCHRIFFSYNHYFENIYALITTRFMYYVGSGNLGLLAELWKENDLPLIRKIEQNIIFPVWKDISILYRKWIYIIIVLTGEKVTNVDWLANS